MRSGSRSQVVGRPEAESSRKRGAEAGARLVEARLQERSAGAARHPAP